MSYLSCFGHIQVFASPRYSTYPRRALGILEKRHQRVTRCSWAQHLMELWSSSHPKHPTGTWVHLPAQGQPRDIRIQDSLRCSQGWGAGMGWEDQLCPWTHGGGDGSCTRTFSVGIIHGDNKEQGYQLIHRGGEEKVLLGRTFETWFHQQRSTTTKNSKQLFCQQTFWKKKWPRTFRFQDL